MENQPAGHQCVRRARAGAGQVVKAWGVLAERSGWAKLPRFALGVSSGGAMVLALALRLPLDGARAPAAIKAAASATCLGMAAGGLHLLRSPALRRERCELRRRQCTRCGRPRFAARRPARRRGAHDHGRAADDAGGQANGPGNWQNWAFPPTMFVHMERDTNTARAVAADMALLKKQARAARHGPAKGHSKGWSWAGQWAQQGLVMGRPKGTARCGRAQQGVVMSRRKGTARGQGVLCQQAVQHARNALAAVLLRGRGCDAARLPPCPLSLRAANARSGPPMLTPVRRCRACGQRSWSYARGR